MFIGVYSPDKTIPARMKLLGALRRHRERFHRDAEVCLTSPIDAEELLADPMTPDLVIRGVNYIPRFTFYIGVEEPGEGGE